MMFVATSKLDSHCYRMMGGVCCLPITVTAEHDTCTSLNDLLCRVYRERGYMSRAWGRNDEKVQIYQAISIKAGDYYTGSVLNHDVVSNDRTLASKIRSYCVYIYSKCLFL